MRALEIKDLSFAYGLVEVLSDVTLHVDEGEIVALIGPNGAGKSTLLNVIAGTYRGARGGVQLFGDAIEGATQVDRVRRGVVLVPEGREVFASLDVEDNLRLGAYARRRSGDTAESLKDVYEFFPRLADRRRQVAGTLSGGEQQMLAIGRALMSGPRVLLLDEPSLGLAPQLVAGILGKLRELRDRGITILLVEQNARAALRLADRGYLLETGSVSVSGTAEELTTDKHVLSVYLGAGDDAQDAKTGPGPTPPPA
jgi:branched-chain amino acid transport system ATP-binding protein